MFKFPGITLKGDRFPKTESDPCGPPPVLRNPPVVSDTVTVPPPPPPAPPSRLRLVRPKAIWFMKAFQSPGLMVKAWVGGRPRPTVVPCMSFKNTQCWPLPAPGPKE